MLLENLNALLGSLFSWLTSIYSLYISGGILTGFLVLWLLRKVATLFNRLK